MSEEVISLTGQSSKPVIEAAPEVSEAIHSFDNKTKTLGLVTDEMSSAQVVQAILEAPEETLIPWEEVALPSRGLYYNWTSGVIKVRPWGAKIDQILATQRLVQSGQAVNQMIAHSCRFPDGFDVDQLLVGDHVFLLYYLRGITHGNDYEFAVQTPSGTVNTFTFDLNDLADTIVFGDPAIAEPARIDLPHISAQLGRDVYVSIRFMRVGDSQAIAKQKVALNKAIGAGGRARAGRRPNQPLEVPTADAIQIDDTITKNLGRLIVDVMGEKIDRHSIDNFLDKLHSSDIAAIREWLRDYSPSIDPLVTLIDPESGKDFQVMLPITESFFRPQNG